MSIVDIICLALLTISAIFGGMAWSSVSTRGERAQGDTIDPEQMARTLQAMPWRAPPQSEVTAWAAPWDTARGCAATVVLNRCDRELWVSSVAAPDGRVWVIVNDERPAR